MDFDEYLEELADPSQRLRVSQLPRLSQLTPEQRYKLDAVWPSLNVRRRRRLIHELSDLTEDNVELNFDVVFLRGMRDDDADVRAESVRGSWENESPEIIDPLIELLHNDKSVEVRREAALALGRFVLLASLGKLRSRHFERVEAGLRRVVEDKTEIQEVRSRALEAAGAYDTAWVRQAVREAYESGDPTLKVSAVHAMGRSAEPRWLPLVTRELASDDAEMRYEAATAAGGISDESVVQSLLPLLLDEDEEVREAATMALGEIGGTEARNALMLMMDSESKATRDAAAAALAEIEFEEDPLGFKMKEGG
jgi:HEAT repeat protein